MKLLLPVLLSFYFFQAYPQANLSTVKCGIDSILAGKRFESTLMGIDIYDLTVKEELYRRNEKLLFRPASNLKILTTVAGLKYLEPGYNFKTSALFSGKIKNGVLRGNIYIVGGCDPDFSIQDLDLIALNIKSLGLKKITGNLYGDISMMDSLFWGKGWMWDDDPSTDVPYLSALNINANTVGVIVKPGHINKKAKIILVPGTNFFKVENLTETVPADSPSTINFSRDWIDRKNTLIIKGNMPDRFIPESSLDTLRINVFDPGLYFMYLFKEALAKYGVKAGGKIEFEKAGINLKSICKIEHSLLSVIHKTNKISYNLGAEMILRAIAVKYFGKPATAENGIKFVDSLISSVGMDPSDYRIVDGSGVSHYNLVSANLILQILKYIYFQRHDIYKIIYNSFPVAGVDGTLKNRLKDSPVQNNVHAKTGTLSGVCALSGYLTAENGHLIAFSMLVQSYVGSSRTYRELQDKICNILASY